MIEGATLPSPRLNRAQKSAKTLPSSATFRQRRKRGKHQLDHVLTDGSFVKQLARESGDASIMASQGLKLPRKHKTVVVY
jgi:hypothetical protein